MPAIADCIRATIRMPRDSLRQLRQIAVVTEETQGEVFARLVQAEYRRLQGQPCTLLTLPVAPEG
jgi:hypothetical protein